MNFKNNLIFFALPYSNGLIHFGHLCPIISADVFSRFFRLNSKNKTFFFSASDQFGTPIWKKSLELNSTPEKISEYFHNENKKILKKLDISLDLFDGTNRKSHIQNVLFFKKILRNKIKLKIIKKIFCKNCNKFLLERFILGNCNKCKKFIENSYCENCNVELNMFEIINPKCVFCKKTVILKEINSYFLKFSQNQKFIENNFPNQKLKLKDIKFLKNNFLIKKIEDWEITRKIPWGIPFDNEFKFYVWFEALLKYIDLTNLFFKNKNNIVWNNSKKVFFIGKDNLFFHSIIFPLLLKELNLSYNIEIFKTEFLLFNSLKFSKSKSNNSLNLSNFLKLFPSDYIRFAIMFKLPDFKDSNFSWDEFIIIINNNLIEIILNTFHRISNIIFFDMEQITYIFKKKKKMRNLFSINNFELF